MPTNLLFFSNKKDGLLPTNMVALLTKQLDVSYQHLFGSVAKAILFTNKNGGYTINKFAVYSYQPK